MEATNVRQSFVIYNSFFEAAANLDDKTFRECFMMIRDYALYGKDVKSENWAVNVVMEVAKPVLDAANKRFAKKLKKQSKQSSNE